MRSYTKFFSLRFYKKINFFKFFLKNKAGRTNNNSSVTILSKGVMIKTRSVLVVLKKLYRCLFLLCFIFKSKKKLFSFCKQTTGSLFIIPYIYGSVAGQISIISNIPNRFFGINAVGNILLLKFLDKLCIFSNIIINTKPKYATSNGTMCNILDKFIEYNIICVGLPSKQTKLISGWCFVFTGRNSLLDSNLLIKSKAGTLKIYGRKPKVRGVARNPVDHPHGGRTKTNQPEKSIWGWVAKNNK